MDRPGRKSAASLSVARIQPAHRPDPPKTLTREQKALWRDVVASKPAEWFTPDTLPLLVAYVKAVTTDRLIARQIDEFDPAALSDNDGLMRYNRLARMADRQARLIGLLASKMRLCQQARYRADRADVLHRNHARGAKPWEDA